MTASDTAASNGHTKSQPVREHSHGMARVEEAQGYHLASVARDAAGEAERLCSAIMPAVQPGWNPIHRFAMP